MTVEIITGDCRDAPADMAEGSVHCCPTSPPYWGLRKYAGEQERVWRAPDLLDCPHPMDCEHEWGTGMAPTVIPPRPYHSGSVLKGTHGCQPSTAGRGATLSHGAFCQVCGAWRGALGLEPTPELYVAHIVEVFRGVWRVLRDDGSLWLNLGDCYTSGGRGGGGRVSPGTLQETHTAADITERAPQPAGLKPKDLLGMPWRVAFALQADGWYLRSAIVWAKGLSFCDSYAGSVMPQSCKDRPTSAYEMVFLMTKNAGKSIYWTHRDGPSTRKAPRADYRWRNVYTGEEVAVRPGSNDLVECPACEGTGHPMAESDFMGRVEMWRDEGEDCEVCGGKREVRLWRRFNLWTGHDTFYDWYAAREAAAKGAAGSRFDTGKTAHHQLGGAQKGNRRRSKVPDGWDTAPGAHGTIHRQGRSKGAPSVIATGTRNWRNVWVINPQSFADAHFATYPEALVEKCITAGTSPYACRECGAPWARVVSQEASDWQGRKAAGAANGSKVTGHNASHGEGTDHTLGQRTATLAAWQTTCGHAIGSPARCVVLDPFGGSGTTALVARKMGRDAVLVELSEEYAEMARRRCDVAVTAPLFA